MQQQNKDDLEKEVTIKLKKWQVPYLLGAARLGIWCEDWCGAYIQTAINSYDTHSGRWILKIGFIIDQIKEQTGVKDEEKEYSYDDALNAIQRLVDKQCQQNEACIAMADFSIANEGTVDELKAELLDFLYMRSLHPEGQVNRGKERK